MHISPINTYSNTFKGLWNSSTNLISADEIETVLHKRNLYYPFKDETSASITRAIKYNTYKTMFNDDRLITVIHSGVKVENILPFNEAEYKQYKKLGKKNSPEFIEKIENALRSRNLERYFNSNDNIFIKLIRYFRTLKR